MAGMNTSVALIVVPLLFVAIGYAPLVGKLDTWMRGQVVVLPGSKPTTFVWLGSLAAFGLGVVLAASASEGVLAVAVVVPLIGAIWLMLLVRRDAARNAFFFLCVGWTIIAIVAAWTYALDPEAALFTIPLLVALILGGTANFLVWQRPAGS